jgi:diguanylate cyclase (GGDEF)-like protein
MTSFMTPAYDPWIVTASYLIAVMASYVALELARREHRRGRLEVWSLGGPVVLGTGIWSMHFIGMLAYQLPIELGYREGLTLLSWAAAVAVSAMALWIAGCGVLTRFRLASGSVAMAVGICAMHYTGMAALDMAPGIVWDPWLVGLSALVALVASAAALLIFQELRRRQRHQRPYQALAALVMGAAIAGMHYTGMAAAGVPEGTVCSSAGALGGQGLPALLALSTGGMLALTLLASLHDRASRLAQELQEANKKLQEQALQDPLTTLANRLLFEDRLQHAMARCERETDKRPQRKLAVIFIDLDGFKPVNDSFGHLAGDVVLKDAAQRLLAAARPSDTVARVGGDEFLLLLEDLDGITDATGVASRIIEQLGRPFELPTGHRPQISASLGIALYPDHAGTSKLVLNADAAMYAAKRGGGNTYAVYGPHMDGHAAEQLELQNELRHAIERGELRLHYQPKIDARTGRVVGVEALLRWQNSQHGMVSPSVFIPLAERFGMIVSIGNWVINEACRQMDEWSRSGFTTHIAINVSAYQLRQPDFVDFVHTTLLRHQVDASRLIFEITESAAIDDGEAARQTFERLRRIGVFLSIDDFGTGHPSLSNLRQLPAFQLKIDRSFVQDLESSAYSRAMVDAIVRLAHALGLSVVAEGVESDKQHMILADLGCDELQGFHFARPMEAANLPGWVAAWNPDLTASGQYEGKPPTQPAAQTEMPILATRVPAYEG